jgi:hypothetical protein
METSFQENWFPFTFENRQRQTKKPGLVSVPLPSNLQKANQKPGLVSGPLPSNFQKEN